MLFGRKQEVYMKSGLVDRDRLTDNRRCPHFKLLTIFLIVLLLISRYVDKWQGTYLSNMPSDLQNMNNVPTLVRHLLDGNAYINDYVDVLEVYVKDLSKEGMAIVQEAFSHVLG